MAFISEPLPLLAVEDGKANDMIKLGKLISRLLRAHTVVKQKK